MKWFMLNGNDSFADLVKQFKEGDLFQKLIIILTYIFMGWILIGIIGLALLFLAIPITFILVPFGLEHIVPSDVILDILEYFY